MLRARGICNIPASCRSSTRAKPTTETGLSLGTPYYMSPEQVVVYGNVSLRSDEGQHPGVVWRFVQPGAHHAGVRSIASRSFRTV